MSCYPTEDVGHEFHHSAVRKRQTVASMAAPVELPTDPLQREGLVARLMDPTDALDDLPDLADLLVRPAWHQHATCRGAGTERWFPERGDDVRPGQAICESCPVIAECRTFADQFTPVALPGTWGGATARGRRLTRSRSAPDAA